MNDDRDEIRRRLDIVELVGQRVRLKRSGKNYSGLCPFHDDKSPSFHVSPTTGRYKCFACGESGDVFTWVMKTQGLDFREALKQLAEQAGVTLSKSFDGPKIDRTERENQLAVMQSALIFFRNELKRNSQAQSYLDRRDLTVAVQDEWEIGYAPDVGEALAIHLRKEGRSLAVAEQLFLTQADRSGGYGDKFRGRIMFPIRDERGDLVGFGGRIIGDGNPKYINSSETPLYNKSRVLFGIQRAKDKMMKERHAVLVEGYLDVIACHRAGVTEAVASCGTALADGQVKLMKRFADKVTILYDGDAAGQKAAERAIELFREADFPCKVALLPKGDDPDTLLKTKGPDAIREVIANAETPFDFSVRMMELKLGVESDEFWQEIPKLLSSAPSELALEKHLLRLAGKHPTMKNPASAVAALKREIAKLRRRSGPTSYKQKQLFIGEAATRTLPLHRAEKVFFWALSDPRFRSRLWPFLSDSSLFLTSLGLELRSYFLEKFHDSPPAGDAFALLASLDEDKQQLYADLGFDLTVQELNDGYVDGSLATLAEESKARMRAIESQNASRDAGSSEADEAIRKFEENLRSLGRHNYPKD